MTCKSKIKSKQLGLAILAVAVFIFIYEMVFHGVILGETYKATASLWRSEEAMEGFMPWLMAGQLLMAVMFCYLYAYAKQCSGLKGGVCYGVSVALLLTGPQLVTYAVQPIPGSLVATWIVGGVIELAIAGLIVASIYRHESE